jgi:N-dimethylarginine dimethylaminohydrolase
MAVEPGRPLFTNGSGTAAPADPPRAATFGGPGFLPRSTRHDEEVQQGLYWTRCGVAAEWGKLKAVLLTRPDGLAALAGDPDSHLFLQNPDPVLLSEQFHAAVTFFQTHGTRVHLLRAPLARQPNLLFVRDLFAMTDEGAVLARPASRQRAGEERRVQARLAAIGIPIARSMRGEAHFEGADLVRVDSGCAAIGIGRRTNLEGARSVADYLSGLGVRSFFVDLPEATQHLLGVLNFLDDGLVAVDAYRAPADLKEFIRSRGIRVVEIPFTEELTDGRSLNFVTLGPREAVMSTGCPRTRRMLEREGVRIFELDVSEYLKAGGGLACATGIIHRQTVTLSA